MLRVTGVNQMMRLPDPYRYAGHLADCTIVEVDSLGRKYHKDDDFKSQSMSQYVEVIGLPWKPWEKGAGKGLGNATRGIRNTEVREGLATAHREKVVSDELMGFLGTLRIEDAGLQGGRESSAGESDQLGARAQALGSRINDAGSRPVIMVRLVLSPCVQFAIASDACRLGKAVRGRPSH
jgi:hypothetical protein